MVVLLDARYLLQVWSKEVRPAVRRYDRGFTLVTHELCIIAIGQIIHSLCNGLQAINLRSAVKALKKPKTPVWRKLCVADTELFFCSYRHGGTLPFHQPVVLENEVETTNDIVCTLSSFVGEEVNLPRQHLTVHSKHDTFPWC